MTTDAEAERHLKEMLRKTERIRTDSAARPGNAEAFETVLLAAARLLRNDGKYDAAVDAMDLARRYREAGETEKGVAGKP